LIVSLVFSIYEKFSELDLVTIEKRIRKRKYRSSQNELFTLLISSAFQLIVICYSRTQVNRNCSAASLHLSGLCNVQWSALNPSNWRSRIILFHFGWQL